jgi:hypothetical protein
MDADTTARIRTNHAVGYVVFAVGQYVVVVERDTYRESQTSPRRAAVAAASRRFSTPSLLRMCET